MRWLDFTKVLSPAERLAVIAEQEARRSRHKDALEHEFRLNSDAAYRRWWFERQEQLRRQAQARFRARMTFVGLFVLFLALLFVPTWVKISLVGILTAVIAYRGNRLLKASGPWWRAPRFVAPAIVLAGTSVGAGVALTL